MSWAARRRFLILLIIGIVVAAFVSIVGIATFYRAPSCTDNVQNQGESGIDCGGPCAFLCREQLQPPTVLFTKAVRNGSGRVDVVAEIENKNTIAAAKNVSYTITLYGADQALIQEVSGTLDLPPSTTIPVFFPGISSGNQLVERAFLDIKPSTLAWYSLPIDPRIIPIVSNITQGGTTVAPRIDSVLLNPSLKALANVPVIILVHNGSGEVVAASATIIPSLPAQGQAVASFTWDYAFPSVSASIEVVPIIPLP